MPRSRRLRVGGGAALIVLVAWVVWSSRAALLHAHPAYAVWLTAALLQGLWLLLRDPRGDGTSQPRMRRTRAVLTVGLAVILAVVTLAARPLRAEEPALGAMSGISGVEVREDSDAITLVPPGRATTVGLTFVPGAFVDPRAYAATLTPLAASGFPVVIVKPPMGFGLLAEDPVKIAADKIPSTRWVVGGHSLGGVKACELAMTDRVSGVLLWASYPQSSIRLARVPVLSVSGSADGLTTPADIDASREQLPPDAQFLEVDGGVHAFFGDYGAQRGDGTPTIPRDQAQREIVEVSIELLTRVREGG